MIGRVLPVGAFVHLFRELLESDPFYADLWLEGEISDFSRSAAGHCYFTLRDEDGAIKCVMFRGQALRQMHLPRAGDQVAVHGGLTVYPRSGAVQLSVDLLQPAGLGAAALELAYLRQRLAAEGLFDASRKRPVPPWPRVIGVVTSAHGAAWHDIQSVVGRRYPLAALLLSPAQVQGDGAATSVVAALEALQRDERAEVIILARGGGASDDLAAFNDERVVRAIFACHVPVIAGIGHATDQTLAEEAADLSAPTPSAAAELCVPSFRDLAAQLIDLQERLTVAGASLQAERAASTTGLSLRLQARSPRAALEREEDILLHLSTRARVALGHRLSHRQREAAATSDLLQALDPSAVLARGYAVLEDARTGHSVFSVDQIARGESLLAVLRDGTVAATVDSIQPAFLPTPARTT
ncbi:MAG: exodeoxyribonuclease VII large subunit [Thermomicrobiales bacterium]